MSDEAAEHGKYLAQTAPAQPLCLNTMSTCLPPLDTEQMIRGPQTCLPKSDAARMIRNPQELHLSSCIQLCLL